MKSKNHIWTICFIFSFINIHAQNLRQSSIILAYDDVSVGRNINFTYHKPVHNKWTIYAGLKYHINSKYYRNDYTLKTFLFKELVAKNAIEHLGIKLGAEKIIGKGNPFYELFLYYDFQLTRATSKTINESWSTDGIWGKRFPEIDESYHLLYYSTYENILGIGLRLKIKEHINFRLQAGLGLNHIQTRGGDYILNGQSIAVKNENPSASFIYSRQFSLGLAYAMRKEKSLKTKTKFKVKEPHLSGSLGIGYDDIQTGRTFNISYRQELHCGFAVYGALKYHINTRFYRDYSLTSHYYFKQFRPEGFSEHLGANIGVDKVFTMPDANVEPFLFYELQAMRATVSNLVDLDEFQSGGSRNLDNAPFFAQEIDNEAYFMKYGPVLALEHYLGAGIRMALSEKVKLRIKAGLGYNIYLGPEQTQDYPTRSFIYNQPNINEGIPWTAKKSEVSRMFSFGLEYRITKR